MLTAGQIIEFDRKKHFQFVKPLGNGGTGDTHLFKDETTDMLFAFKKFVPKDLRDIDDLYRRFVDEIKILMKLSHPNIVRVYNYYLYPEIKTGYLQMEYIDGQTIDEFVPVNGGKDWNTIFLEVISAFEYLEMHKTLHRDIRPANIMIDNEETVKIIDFGFGKQLQSSCQVAESVFLNWPVTELPDEVQFNQEYTNKTEIFFMGKLFQKLLKDRMESFKYGHVIERMIKTNPIERYDYFSEVSKAISAGIMEEIDFTDEEKAVYIKFADALVNILNHHTDKYIPVNDVSSVLASLAELIRYSALERYLQHNARLIQCFVSNGFIYLPKFRVEVNCIKEFNQLLKSLSPIKQKVVLDNIDARLSRIKIENEDEELPF